jgi:hypothetical protein
MEEAAVARLVSELELLDRAAAAPEDPLIVTFKRELAVAGLLVRSLNELQTLGSAPPEVARTVLRWLPLWPDRGMKLAMASSLGHPWARSVAPLIPPMYREFARSADADDRYTAEMLAGLILTFAREYDIEVLADLCVDQTLGGSRALVIFALTRKPKYVHRITSVVHRLLEEGCDDLMAMTLVVAKRFKVRGAEDMAERYESDPREGYRSAARAYRRIA